MCGMSVRLASTPRYFWMSFQIVRLTGVWRAVIVVNCGETHNPDRANLAAFSLNLSHSTMVPARMRGTSK